jgi:hypothetical protein
MILLLSLLALFEITVLLPKRLEDERQARRDAPPKLIPPGQRAIDDPPQQVITAFRLEDWRPRPRDPADPLVWRGDPAGVYLGGYLAVQEGEKLVESGDIAAARRKYELAAKVFGMIHERSPDFEPAMVDFRRRKIAEVLTQLAEIPTATGPPEPQPQPQSNLDRGGEREGLQIVELERQ